MISAKWERSNQKKRVNNNNNDRREEKREEKKPVNGRAIKANSAMAIKTMTRLNTHNQISKPK